MVAYLALLTHIVTGAESMISRIFVGNFSLEPTLSVQNFVQDHNFQDHNFPDSIDRLMNNYMCHHGHLTCNASYRLTS